MKPAMLLEWQNLIFLLPMAFALILLGVSMLGGDHHEGDHDADSHIGHEVDGYGLGGGQDVADASLFSRMLDMLGVGRVPVSILVFTWCMLFGFTGLLLQHYFLAALLPARLPNVIVSAFAAFAASGFLTSLLARLIGRVMPRLESYGEQKQDFINREAEVRYTITASSGTVTLTDKYGNLQQLQVYLHESCKEAIPPHAKVILLSYDAAEDAFLAVPSSQLTAA
jgi:membrane protein implicated in regulation of membrane protease activity